MILARFKERPKILESALEVGITKTRWHVEVKWFSVCIAREYFRSEEWCVGGGYYMTGIAGPWQWGRHHVYYDGPHEVWWFGFLYFNWQGDWCEECAKELGTD